MTVTADLKPNIARQLQGLPQDIIDLSVEHGEQLMGEGCTVDQAVCGAVFIGLRLHIQCKSLSQGDEQPMKYQVILDPRGNILFVHKFGWVSDKKFVSKLPAKHSRILTSEHTSTLCTGAENDAA